MNVDKYYNEIRNCQNVSHKDAVIIEDITSTEHTIIDSLSKVKKVQDEIARILGKSKCNSDLEFLIKWNTFENEEKNKKYSNFCCHEVNLFIFFKDPEYFRAVVRPFLQNKMEKSFIDYWLLEDYEKIKSFSQIEYLEQLNSLEKCLLISSIRKDDIECARSIADLIKMRADKSDYSPDEKIRFFDTVLNLNILNKGDPGDALAGFIEDVKQE